MSRLAVLSVSAAALLATPALATATYPLAVQTHLGLAAPPLASCALCHANGVATQGTVTTPFGASAKSLGLVANNEASLRSALDALARAGTDSDADGTADIDELRAGSNPNVSATAPSTPALVYGCGAQALPGPLEALSLTGWLLAAVGGRRARTRRLGVRGTPWHSKSW